MVIGKGKVRLPVTLGSKVAFTLIVGMLVGSAKGVVKFDEAVRFESIDTRGGICVTIGNAGVGPSVDVVSAP